MKTKNTLHQLIHSLNKGEKRNFKLLNDKYKGNEQSNSMKLFDALNKQKEYDAEKLKKVFKGHKLADNLNYEQHKLQKMILDFLARHLVIKDPLYELNFLQNQVLVLSNKEQWELCVKVCEQGIKLAEKNHCVQPLYFFSKVRLNLAELFDRSSLANRTELLTQFESIMEMINVESDCYKIYTKVTHLVQFEKPLSPQKLAWLLESPYFKEDSKAVTFESKIYLFDTKATYYEVLQDNEQAAVYQKKIVDLFESEPTIILRRMYDFFVYQFNYMRILLVTGRLKESEERLNKIHTELYLKYKKHFDEDIANVYDSFYKTLYFALLQKQHRYEDLYQILEQSRTGKSISYSELRIVEGLTFLVLSCFALGKYQEGIDSLNVLEEGRDMHIYQEEYVAAKSFSFLCFFELGQNTMLESIYKALYYFFRKHKLEGDYHQTLMKILRKLSKPTKQESQEAFFVKVREQLLKTDYDVQWGGELLLLWLEAKIEGKNLQQIIEQNRLMKV